MIMNVRSFLQLALLAVTGLALVATSRAHVCSPGTLDVRAVTTCGPPANVSLTAGSQCAVSAGGADFGGLPSSGSISSAGPDDAGLDVGFALRESDGGVTHTCTATPADGGGFDLVCTDCPIAGGSCVTVCTGTLTPQ